MQATTLPDIPGFEMERRLGSGGFSDVLLCRQDFPKRKVAIKVLRDRALQGADARMFIDEANRMAQLSAHPFIVTIHQAGIAADSRPYIVLEYCPGPSLADRYASGPLDVVDVLRTGVRLAGAVATAHAAGIIHRDIKPANVLTNDFGWPALADFGISSGIDDASNLDTRHRGEVSSESSEPVGLSVPWSPPELFSDEPRADVRSDGYSLAATLHTLLAGRSPFQRTDAPNRTSDVIGRIQRGEVNELPRTVPRNFRDVLAKGMAGARADRYRSAMDFARALQRIELELGYIPTQLEIPGPDAELDAAQDSDDLQATQVRSLVIDPVPVRAETAAGTGAETVVGRPDDGDCRRRRFLVGAIAALGSLAAVLAAVAVTLAISSGANDGSGEDPSSGQGAPADEQSRAPSPSGADPDFPQPEVIGVDQQGPNIVFTIANPDPEVNDVFIWRGSAESDNDYRNNGADQRIVIEDPGEAFCISIAIVRAERPSVPVEACYEP